jgi:NAD(P)-dependent dehydrogenase (short-subunit alcohol dehydrogenase family)
MTHIALITGASRGLGATLARFLAARHYSLVLNARSERDLNRQADELRATGATIHARAGDIADEATRRALVDTARELGGLDLLVNNASTLGGIAPLARVNVATLDRVLNVNLVAPLALTAQALPLLAVCRGLVVNISSDAALGAYPGWGVYGASKAALDLATRTWANELSTRGISLVAVDPGDMRTDMHQEAFLGEDISDRPLPEVTLPFWAWLLEQDRTAINGQRFNAQQHQALPTEVRA